jgi:hypothetical protein
MATRLGAENPAAPGKGKAGFSFGRRSASMQDAARCPLGNLSAAYIMMPIRSDIRLPSRAEFAA